MVSPLYLITAAGGASEAFTAVVSDPAGRSGMVISANATSVLAAAVGNFIWS